MKDISAQALRECLGRVGRVSEQLEDLEQLLLAIIEECARLLNCAAASVAIYDAQDNLLTFAVASGEASQQVRRFRMKMGEGVVGRVAVERQAYYTNDPANDPAWCSKVDHASSFVTRNLAAVPMVRKGLLIGVLEALNCQAAEGFAPQDLELLQIFADQVAIAIENHRLMLAKLESERLATFGVALADIGHSVKNILMRLESPIKLMDRGLDEQRWELLSGCWPVMKRATHDIGSLVREMLAYSGTTKPALEAVDVAALVREAAGQCQADAASKSIALELEGADRELNWAVDPKAVHYALHNMIGNALEALAEHGGTRIIVRVEVDGGGDTLRLEVSDDGPGIPPEIQKRVFEPFFTTKKSKGTGLGLANVKKGVEACGGRVVLDSAPGRGTTFTLFYPPPVRD